MERAAEFKSEYVGGEIFMMAGASLRHNRIVLNIGAALSESLATGRCEPFVSDMRVNVGAAYFYPDVVVVCGEIELVGNIQDTLLNPTVIFEVLSPSTEGFDRGEKFARYAEIPSLQDYILVSQDHCRIEHYTRHADDKWLFAPYAKPDATVDLPSIGCIVRAEDVYRKVEWESEEGASNR
jgi:Uma2 family endonuclease